MKKAVIILLAITMMFGVVGCSNVSTQISTQDNGESVSSHNQEKTTEEVDTSIQNDIAVTTTSANEIASKGTTSTRTAKGTTSTTTSARSAQGETPQTAANGNTTTGKKETTTANVGVYTVTFDLGYDGKSFVAQSKNYKVAKPEDPVRNGYVFQGWYPVNESTPWSFVGYMVTEDMKLVAQWGLPKTTRTKKTSAATTTKASVEIRPTINYNTTATINYNTTTR